MRHVTILYFAALREALGRDREAVSLPAEIATAGQLRAWLRTRGDTYAAALAEGRAVRVAVDHTVAQTDTPLNDGSEIAFFPPVTGG